MLKCSVRLNDHDEIKLKKYMEVHDIKNVSEAIRKCIDFSSDRVDITLSLHELESKINRLISVANFTKKLLEQFYANTGFSINSDPKDDETLKDFYEKNYSRGNNFLG